MTNSELTTQIETGDPTLIALVTKRRERDQHWRFGDIVVVRRPIHRPYTPGPISPGTRARVIDVDPDTGEIAIEFDEPQPGLEFQNNLIGCAVDSPDICQVVE